ncbi:ATP-grasp domain-containing protein [Acaryochloris marina]|uniref:ATP-grasp domain-containing protein n=1 Tax=Acaryochloris marina (strain MBIC 11017) TaxID=329726 RepID=B0C1W2_ACAM1|nr:hypothetical protein [Acaryochloris marina]ABW26128.1 hypothetical protein AM1_1089 [Acaryochloris marina MBIC11017]BDM80966.1 hypothetical protein AM10699_38330 [Acaryochloris marina MBIC10699]
MKIFNHDIQTSTHEAVGGTHLYSGRVLGLSGQDDIVQIHPALKSEWGAICAHYLQVGLSHSQNVVWDLSLDHLQCKGYEPSVYLFGDAVHKSSAHAKLFRAMDASWFQVVEFINSKNNFMHLAQTLNMAVPSTACFHSAEAIPSLDRFAYPCYFKPSVSDSGFGIVRCTSSRQLSATLLELGNQIPFQVQVEVATSTFINLQYQITENGVRHLLASEQILNGCVHGGNRYPTMHQPWSLFDPMAEWLAQQGMKGVFAFDAAVIQNGSAMEYLAIECNPRFNGSSYPTLIAEKLGIPQWSCETFETHHHSLADIDLKGLEFEPQTGTGIILINWGTVLVGKISVLLAGTIEQQATLKQHLQQRLVDPKQLSISTKALADWEPARI